MSNTELGGSITTDEPAINRATLTDEGQTCWVFCSKTVFNLSHKILTETEIKVLEKRLDFSPVQRTLSEPELRKYFEYFCRLLMKFLEHLAKYLHFDLNRVGCLLMDMAV